MQDTPSPLNFAHLWQQEELSDITIVLKQDPEPVQGQKKAGSKKRKSRAAAAPDPTVIRTLPGHRAILSGAAYFRAQVQRWQQQQEEQSGSKQAAKPEASITLHSEDEEPAAMAVLAALYGVSTPPEQLSDVQLLQMVLLADMLQVPAVAAAAVRHVAAVAVRQPGLSDAAVQYLRGMHAWPSCLLAEFPQLTMHMALQDVAAMWASAAAPSSPADIDAVLQAPHGGYMQQRLLAALPDLENLWHYNYQDMLLGLPLPAVQLLLETDLLKVVTEDTVLFTAQAYLDAQPDPEQRQAAAQQLAPLIRCPHLSRAWLCAAARAAPEELPLLQPYKHEVGECLAFLQTIPWQQRAFASLVPSTPASWLRGPRVSSVVPQKVQLNWTLSVDALKRACLDAAESGTWHDVMAPLFGRPLLGVRMQLVAGPGTRDGSITPTLLLRTSNAPSCMYNALVFDLKLPGPRPGLTSTKRFAECMRGRGLYELEDAFGVGAMARGWDEAAWVGRGLPASGQFVIECQLAPVVM